MSGVGLPWCLSFTINNIPKAFPHTQNHFLWSSHHQTIHLHFFCPHSCDFPDSSLKNPNHQCSKKTATPLIYLKISYCIVDECRAFGNAIREVWIPTLTRSTSSPVPPVWHHQFLCNMTSCVQAVVQTFKTNLKTELLRLASNVWPWRHIQRFTFR